MVLEATVVCIDNSDWMINGDYKPTRLQAQTEAVNLLAGAKTGSNPENTVGVLSLAGIRGPKVMATPTPDLGRVLSCMQEIRPEGQVSLVQGVQVSGIVTPRSASVRAFASSPALPSDAATCRVPPSSSFASVVQIAQLALKHRQNKNQRQRIVAFIGSPLAEEEKVLVKAAKKLKKNNVAVDIVSFGDEGIEANGAKLEAFFSAVNSNDTSHLVTVPPGTGILSDVLLSTPVFTGEDGGMAGAGGAMASGSAGAGAGGNDFEFGVDPNLDPELALALRVSMEEERARQEAAARAASATPADAGGADQAPKAEEGAAPPSAEADTGAAAGPATDADGDVQMDDDAILQQALAMSLAPSGGAGAATTPPSAPSGADGGAGSVPSPAPGSASSPARPISNLPGVDVSDANVQQVLSALKEQQQKGASQSASQPPQKKQKDDKSKE